ncbi:MAG: YfiR family protein [bacterium]
MSRRRSASERLGATLLLALLCIAGRARAQAPADEAQIKAAFVFNFLKFVDWPATATRRSDEQLVVAIIGDGPSADAVTAFLTAKRVGERPIVVKVLNWDQSLAGVHAAFVSETDARKRRRVFDAAASASVLSIGEGHDFALRGGVIGLVVEEQRVRFDIDADAAEAARIRISSKLLALGHAVHSGRNTSGEAP